MAVSIISRTITDKLRPSSNVTWSLFAIGEPIEIQIVFEVYTYKTFTTNSKLFLGDVATNNQYALSNNSGRLNGINVGDTIRIVDSGSSFDETVNVVSVISNNLIVTDYDFGSSFSGYDGAVIYNLTAITGVAMPYNFVENNEATNFLSKVDGTLQKLWAQGLDASDTTPIPMNFDGSLCYQVGSATIQGDSWDTATGRQRFSIKHNTIVTPYFLASQITDLSNGLAPTYFSSGRCLKHIYQIDAFAVYSNPNSVQSVVSPFEIGNSGWFNEVFNGGLKDYEIQNVVIKNQSGTTIPKLENTTDTQTIEFDIYSSAGHWTTVTNLEVAFGKLPNNQAEYQNNGELFERNFLFTNTKLDTSGSGVAPSTFGETYQTISEISATITDVNNIHVVITFIFGGDAVGCFNLSAQPKYLFWTTISNPSLSTAAGQNKQAISSGVLDLVSSTLTNVVQYTKKFIRHYEQVTDDGVVGDVDTFKNDECVMYSSVFLQPLIYPLTTIYKQIKSQIIAKKTDGTEFVIEDFTIIPSQSFSGANQLVSYNSNRVFQIPVTEPRDNFTISNCYADGDKIRFDITHGFMIRWEDWVQLIGASNDFYDSTEPNNGLNQDWFRYQNTDWNVYHRVQTLVSYGGTDMTYTEDTKIIIHDYESNTDFVAKDVETYTMAGNSLYDSVNSRWYIQSTANTQVKATFEKNTAINISLCYVVFGIEIYEQGGIGGRQRYSSKWQTSTPLTCFIPLTGVSGNRVELTQPTSDTIVAKAVIDYTLLPQGNITYTIVARLYENDGTANYKVTEDDVNKFTEDDEQKIIE